MAIEEQVQKELRFEDGTNIDMHLKLAESRANYDDEDELNPKNFISKLYQNDAFINIKKQYEEDIIH